MNVLVTGGAGYIGSILVGELLKKGHNITVLDNFMYGETSLAHVCFHPKFHVVRGDIRDQRLMKDQLKTADIVIPLAALVGAPICDQNPVGAKSINQEAPIKLFNQLSSNQWVLMPTTNSAYGTGQQDLHCDENSPLNPISQYAREKVLVEKALMDRENAISFRLATAFGISPRMRIDLLVNDFTYRAVKDRVIVLFESHFKRNFIHIRDISKAFLLGIEKFDRMKGEIFNVGLSDSNLSKMELCQAIKKFIPQLSIMEAESGSDPDQRNYIVSNAKIEAMGFEPDWPLEKGIQELIKGYHMLKNTRYGNA